jgi:hypothetical protein
VKISVRKDMNNQTTSTLQLYNLLAVLDPSVFNFGNVQFGVCINNEAGLIEWMKENSPDQLLCCILIDLPFSDSFVNLLQSNYRFKLVYFVSSTILRATIVEYPVLLKRTNDVDVMTNKLFSLPAQIHDGIFIGTAHHATNPSIDFKADYGFSLAINLTERPVAVNGLDPEQVIHMPCIDATDFDIKQTLIDAKDVIFARLSLGQRVFVFCQKGASRSGSVILYCYCLIHKLSLEEGLAAIRRFYYKLAPNKAFLEAIGELLLEAQDS